MPMRTRESEGSRVGLDGRSAKLWRYSLNDFDQCRAQMPILSAKFFCLARGDQQLIPLKCRGLVLSDARTMQTCQNWQIQCAQCAFRNAADPLASVSFILNPARFHSLLE